MKLVNIHKQLAVLLFVFSGFQSVKAREWSLQQCIDTAQIHNSNLQIGRNSNFISKQKEREAKSNLIPKVTARC